MQFTPRSIFEQTAQTDLPDQRPYPYIARKLERNTRTLYPALTLSHLRYKSIAYQMLQGSGLFNGSSKGDQCGFRVAKPDSEKAFFRCQSLD